MTPRRGGLKAAPGEAAPRKGFSWWRALFSVGLLAAVCSTINWQEEVALLRHIAWGWVAAAMLLHVVNRFVGAVKWQVLLKAKGIVHPYRDLVRIIWVSNFFGHFLPSAVGGDSLRMWQAARRSERAPEAVSTVFVERLTGVMSLAALAVLGGVWSFARWGEHLIILTLLVPLGALLAVLSLLWTPWGERALTWGLSHFRRLPGHPFLLKAVGAVQSFHRHPRPVLASLALSSIVQCSRVLSVLCLAQAAGTSLYVGEAFVVVPSALFIAMLPLTVNGLGLHEGAFVVLLGFVDISQSAAFALALLSRVVMMTSNLPGGILFLLEGFEGRRRAQAILPTNGSRPLRVLWLADKLGYGEQLHGLGQYYLSIGRSLRSVEMLPVVFRLDDSLGALFARRGLPLRRIAFHPLDPRNLWTLLRLIHRERIDLLQAHGYQASLLGRIAGWLTGRPVIVRQGDLVPEPWLAWASDRLLSRLTARAIAISEPVREFCVEERAIPAGRIQVIPHAIRPLDPAGADELESLRTALGLPREARVISSLTRLHAIKGVQVLIEAMPALLRQVPAAHLVLWGDGPQRQALEQQAHTLGVASAVHFAGFHPEAARYLCLADCFVLPSLSEGFSFALLEAMAAGRPIVASRTGGIPHVVQEGKEALLVPPGDPDSLAGALARVLTDAALAARLAEAAHAASRRFSMSQHITALERLYERVIGERRSPVGVSTPRELRTLSYRLWRSVRKVRGDVHGLCLGRYPSFVFRGDPGTVAGHVPVFAFHSVVPEAFEAQLRYLKENGYETVRSADELAACLQGRAPLRPKTVLLTFDDGRASLYRVAYPLLQRYGYQAVGFVVPTFVGKRNFCSWQQLKEMAASGVVDIQSHTLCHRFAPRWPLIVRCLNGTDEFPAEASKYVTMEEDYRRSRELIEERLGRPVRHLCYPDFQGCEASIAASRAAGYVSNFWGVVAGRRANRPGGDDLYRLVRVPDAYLRCLPGKNRQSLARVLGAQLRCGAEGLRHWFTDPSGQRFEQDGRLA